jgi:hypothetical protein
MLLTLVLKGTFEILKTMHVEFFFMSHSYHVMVFRETKLKQKQLTIVHED